MLSRNLFLFGRRAREHSFSCQDYETILCRRVIASFSHDLAQAYITAKLHAFEMYFISSGVCTFTRSFDCISVCCHSKYSSAACNQGITVPVSRSGVENFYIVVHDVDFYLHAIFGGSWISFSSEHNTNCVSIVPLYRWHSSSGDIL